MEETNKLIAEFMGFTKEKNLGYYDNNMNMAQVVYDVQNGNCFDELLFDKSWDWLMSVVEKIENLGYGVTIGTGTFCLIQNDWKEDLTEIDSMTDNSKLLCTYNAIVEFIKLINNKK